MPFFVGSGCDILKNDVGMGGWRNREGQWNVRDWASMMSGSAGPSAARRPVWERFADGGHPGGTEWSPDGPRWSHVVQKQ